MTQSPASRQKTRSPWAAILAVVLGALAGFASGFGFATSTAGGISISDHGLDARTAGKSASVRLDASNPDASVGGTSPDAALSRSESFDPWPRETCLALPGAFRLPIAVALVRDGRSRAPPVA